MQKHITTRPDSIRSSINRAVRGVLLGALLSGAATAALADYTVTSGFQVNVSTLSNDIYLSGNNQPAGHIYSTTDFLWGDGLLTATVAPSALLYSARTTDYSKYEFTRTLLPGPITDVQAGYTAAKSAGSYLTYTFTIPEGYALDLSSAQIGATAGVRAGTATTVDFGDGEVYLGGNYSTSGASTGGQINYLLSDFVSSDLSSITGSFTVINYRWSPVAHANAVGAGLIVLNNYTLYALPTSSVPEPATYAAIFGGLALAGVMIIRRRRTKTA